MRYYVLAALVAAAAVAVGQQDPAPSVEASLAGRTTGPARSVVTIPSGTTVPVKLTSPISTKSARVGDKVYGETAFPLVRDNQMLIPPGTYVQGEITRVQRPGRVKGRAEVLIHFTTLIFPSGYTVVLPGAVQQMPGAEHQRVKGEEGTLQQEGERGKDAAQVARTTGTGALIGAAAGGGKGLGIGAASGGAAGLAIALLTRGSDLRLEAGSTLEMVFQRSIDLDRDRLRKN